MPTYEYACTVCGRRFETLQRIGDDSLTTCEVCGGALRKVFHPAGIVFRGSGFYATDSRSKAGRASSSERSGPDDKEGSKGSSREKDKGKDKGKNGEAPAAAKKETPA